MSEALARLPFSPSRREAPLNSFLMASFRVAGSVHAPGLHHLRCILPYRGVDELRGPDSEHAPRGLACADRADSATRIVDNLEI